MTRRRRRAYGRWEYRRVRRTTYAFPQWGGGKTRSFHTHEVSVFERIIDPENLLLAWYLFRKGKRSRQDVMVFERRLEDNLFDLHDALAAGEYRHGAYEPFTIHDPKQRTIHKATVRDRLAHQAIINVIEPFFESSFIFDSYSCRIGKGTHAAVSRLRQFLRQESRNDARTAYALKCDIRKFFASIDHAVLSSLLERRIHDLRTMELLRHVIGSFSMASGKGIPLGNLTSQLFANVYLHELDRHVKHDLRIRCYVRYCDDFVMLVRAKSEADFLARQIDDFLQARLKIALHPDKVCVRTWRQGIDFLGYVLMPHAMVLRPQTARRMIRNVDPCNLPSYLGLCKHASAYRLEQLVRNKVGAFPEAE